MYNRNQHLLLPKLRKRLCPIPPEEVAEEIIEETIETPVEETTENVEEITEDNDAVEEEISEQESEDQVEPEKKPLEVKPKEVVEEEKKEQKLPKYLYKGKEDSATNTSQGDESDTKGDQGDEEGTVEARAIMGKQGGGGGGPELNLTGWMWESEPRPEHDNVEFDGKITFDFQVDEKGQVSGIQKVPPSTVNASLIQLYRDELEKTTFYQTGSGTARGFTQGRVTFIIKAK